MSIDQEQVVPSSKPDESWIKLEARPESEQARSDLRDVLQSQLNHQECRSARITFVHVLAFLGVLQWFVAGWPSILPSGVATIVSAVWAPCLVGTIALIVLERIFAFRRRRSLADYS